VCSSDLFTFLKDVRDAMADDGIIVLVVPSSAAKFALVYGLIRYVWFGFPEHLHLFSPGSAPALAARVGMDLLEVSTYEYGIEPKYTDVALKLNSAAASTLRAGNSALMGEELIIVLGKSGGALAAKNHEKILSTQLTCENFAKIEHATMLAGKDSLTDPWSLDLEAIDKE
jgi:hypothetical protein